MTAAESRSGRHRPVQSIPDLPAPSAGAGTLEPYQMDVVCKVTPTIPGEAEALQSPKFASELSCCLQDGWRRGQRAKPLRRNVLSPELRCCLQDCTAVASGPSVSAAGGSARQPLDASRRIVSSNRDGGRAICADCRGTPRDIPGRRRSSPCSPCGAFADTLLRRRRLGGAGTSMAGKPAGSSDNAVHPYGRCRIRLALQSGRRKALSLGPGTSRRCYWGNRPFDQLTIGSL